MKRRNLLVGSASLAAGSSALFGTGAFTFAKHERDGFTVAVEGDGRAYTLLKRIPSHAPRSWHSQDYTRYDRKTGHLKLHLHRFNSNSKTCFDSLFYLGNNQNPSDKPTFYCIKNQFPDDLPRKYCYDSDGRPRVRWFCILPKRMGGAGDMTAFDADEHSFRDFFEFHWLDCFKPNGEPDAETVRNGVVLWPPGHDEPRRCRVGVCVNTMDAYIPDGKKLVDGIKVKAIEVPRKDDNDGNED